MSITLMKCIVLFPLSLLYTSLGILMQKLCQLVHKVAQLALYGVILGYIG